MFDTEWRERLRARARELGFSDADVARRAGLSTGRYSGYVVGRREPDLGTLVRICRVLRTTPDVLLGFLDPPSDEDPNRSRAIAALESMDRSRLRIAAALLDTIVTLPQDDAADQPIGSPSRPARRRSPTKSRVG